MTITFSSPSAIISQSIDQKVLHLQWTGVVSSSVFRQTLEHALHLITVCNTEFCIYNTKDLRPMSLQDYDWMGYEFIPQLLESPLKKVAVLESPNELEHLNLRHMVYGSYMAFSFKLKYVDDLASALRWFNKKSRNLSLQVAPQNTLSPVL